MSLQAQEQALFDLLFDEGLRRRFHRDGPEALAGRGLDPGERAAFGSLRVDALEHDAMLRRAMVLSQLCAVLPVTTALAGCVDGLLPDLDALVDGETMRTPQVERSYVFARRLRARWDGLAADEDPVLRALPVVLEAELGMAFTAASLCRETLDLGRPPPAPAGLPEDWRSLPARVAPFVNAAVLPASYAALRAALCTVPDRLVHRLASDGKVDGAAARRLLDAGDPRLLVARAAIDRSSRCDPTARHVTVELSDGFAELVGHADGTRSVDALLAGLRASGADTALLAGVGEGFRELFEAGVLEAVR